jgi:hypothetical protein
MIPKRRPAEGSGLMLRLWLFAPGKLWVGDTPSNLEGGETQNDILHCVPIFYPPQLTLGGPCRTSESILGTPACLKILMKGVIVIKYNRQSIVDLKGQ